MWKRYTERNCEIMKIWPSDMTYIVVDNEDLKKHPQAYQNALNWVDHIIYRHRLNQGPYMWTRELRMEDFKSCKTIWAYVFKVGHRTDPRIIRSHADDEASLQGHILDRKENYYELHDQSFIVRVKHVEGADLIYDDTYRSVKRSEDNYHDDWTPLWIEDGGEELNIKNPSYGSGIISHLLRNGHKVTPYTPELRDVKAYLYHNQVYKKTQKFNNTQDIFNVYPTSTEMPVEVDTENYEHFIGPANGLQALLYTNPYMKNLYFCDINPFALEFTRKLLYKWNPQQSYQTFLENNNITYSTNGDWSISPDEYFWKIYDLNPSIIETIKNIQQNKINVEFLPIDMTDVDTISKYYYKEKTVLYYSNILTYSPTIHLRPIIDCDLIWQSLMAYMPTNSLFIGEVPYRDYSSYFKKQQGKIIDENGWDIPLECLPNHRTQWREQLYDSYYKIGIGRIRKDLQE